MSNILVIKCGIFNDRIPEAQDSLESYIDTANEIDDSFESEADKSTYLQDRSLFYVVMQEGVLIAKLRLTR